MIICPVLFSAKPCFSQIPSIGDSLKLEIANWNLEWFGKKGYGPSDENLQQSNVLDVIKRSNIDIWTFCEVSDVVVFDSFMKQLPEYQYSLCNYLPEQKTAVIFRKDQFKFAGSKLLGTNNPDSFSTQRFPFMIQLIPLEIKGMDTLNIIVLHLKANIGTNSDKLDAYNSRKRSGEWLNMFLHQSQTSRYCIVTGDWNDDIDESIFNGLPSPFATLADNDAFFYFTTRKFTNAHNGTTTGYTDAIDHQLISNPLKNYLIPNSTSIFYLDQFISNYSTTTSDHYPVYSLFNFYSSAVEKINKNKIFNLYPNPSYKELMVMSDQVFQNAKIIILDMSGQCVKTLVLSSGQSIDISELPSGCYQFIINDEGKIMSKKFQVNHSFSK